jgi:hypothetical protein
VLALGERFPAGIVVLLLNQRLVFPLGEGSITVVKQETSASTREVPEIHIQVAIVVGIARGTKT